MTRISHRGIIASSISFTPASVAGFIAWFKADAIIGKTDGNALSQWDDSSGVGNHAFQASGPSQPLYKTGLINNLPIVRFDGSSDFLQTGTIVLPQPCSWFVVCRFTGAYVSVATVHSGRAGGPSLIRASSTDMQSVTAITTTPQSPHVYASIYNGASSSWCIDEGTAGTGNMGTANPAGITIGSHWQNVEFGAVDVGELLVYNTAVTSADRIAINTYLKAKWGTP